MEEQSLLKKILIKIKNFIILLIVTIIGILKKIFASDTKQPKKEINKQEIKPKEKELKKETPITGTNESLPDEDNIKVNPHNNISPDNEEIEFEELYKVYTKDNELKYLNIYNLLDLFLKEELERIYKVEGFKMKKATTKEEIHIEKLKTRVYPEIITRTKKGTLRNSTIIREEFLIKLEEDLLLNPLYPPRLNTIPTPKKKNLKITKKTKVKKEENHITSTLSTDTLKSNLIKQEEPSKPRETVNNIKEVAIGATLTTAAIINELTSKPKEEKQNTELELPALKEKIKKEVAEVKKDSREIVELKQIIEEKIKEEEKKIKEENQEVEKNNQELETKEEKQEIKKEEKTEKKVEENKPEEKIKEEKIQSITDILIQDRNIKKIEKESEEVIVDTRNEINKEDFFEKDYDRIEEQLDKMLSDLTDTYIKYEKTLTTFQKEKLKKEENHLREIKEQVENQKRVDISNERESLDQIITEAEKEGTKKELNKIEEENNKEVNQNFLNKMNRLENMTKEQVANMDRKVMLKRFNKANILLEMSSLLALPFIRNKYFLQFTIGLMIDNHFNFVNGFFNRKLSKYEPADLEEIKQGQDALNGALDITYKNLVELEYLEQRAISRYPELIYDSGFVNQVTKLRTNLNKKYTNLMKKNMTMEKYKQKTKKHIKIFKPKKKNPDQQPQGRS